MDEHPLRESYPVVCTESGKDKNRNENCSNASKNNSAEKKKAPIFIICFVKSPRLAK
jgi:hypothetical protein